MAYLYRHIRLDKNEPFYVGIGDDLTYSRSESKKSRNQWWKNIVNITPYRVDIVLDDLTWDEACQKETEFIKLYGRRDLGLGTLVNLTDGGEGIVNPSQETRDKKSKSMIEAYKNDPTIKQRRKDSLDLKDVGRKVSQNRDHKAAGRATSLTHKNNPEIGKRIGLKLSQNKERGKKLSISLKKPIIQKDLDGNFIKEWPSQKDASEALGIKMGSICSCLKGRYKTAGGFTWEYK